MMPHPPGPKPAKARIGCVLMAACVVLLPAETLHAIPNSIFGPVLLADSPLNGLDLTEPMLAAVHAGDPAALPGRWTSEGRIAAVDISHLMARPKLFGSEVVLVRSQVRDGELEALEATFADAGSWFGYLEDRLPAGADRRRALADLQTKLAARQKEFDELYLEARDAVAEQIRILCGGRAGRSVRVGHTRTLRAEPIEWRHDGLVIRLLADGRRLVRVNIIREGRQTREWRDASLPAEGRARAAALAATVERRDDGTVLLPDIRPVPQGYRPYCGINTLVMATRHFGLHLDEDWLAVAGNFQNTGSAAGADVLRLYQAAAAEAGLGLDRSPRLDVHRVVRAIDSGMPVIVWRRFCHQRNNLHSRFQRELARDPSRRLPDPDVPAERASWPDRDAPLHASVIVGYHPDRKEFVFLESWTGRDVPRRMRVEEMIATTYLSFVFKP